MRILFVLHRFYPDFVGGTEQHALDLARGLVARGHHVAIFYRGPGPAGLRKGEWAGVPVYRAQAGPMTPIRLFASTFFAPRLVAMFRQAWEDFSPDIVYLAHLMGLPAALATEVPRRNRPLVISLHDYWWVCANANLLTNDTGEICEGPRHWINCARCGLARLGIRALMPAAPLLAPLMARRGQHLKHLLHRADRILAFSEFVRSWYLRQGISGRNLLRIRMGIHTPRPISRRTRPEGRIRFFYAGGIAPLKGLHILLQALSQLDEQVELWVAGDTQAFPEYSRNLQARFSHPGIRWLGRLDREELWASLVEADAVVVPSLWHETFSMLVHEAFAAGVPVIASAIGALTEVVQHEVNGLLVPPGNVDAWAAALHRFAQDSSLRAQLRAHIPRVRDFDEYLDEIEHLMLHLAGL